MAKIDLTVVPLEAVLLTLDQFHADQDEKVGFSYCGIFAELIFSCDSVESEFVCELNDYVKRVIIAERVRPIKEIIIGRALYGIVNEC